MHCRTALLNGNADKQLVRRAYLLGFILAGIGCGMVVVAVLGLVFTQVD